MACCVIAAFILAQCVETLRRWGMFWGLVRIPEGETEATFFATVRAHLRSRKARALVFSAVAIECCALVGYIYFEHGEHIAQAVDIAWSRLHGQEVVYSGLCTIDGRKSVRLVLDERTAGR